MHDEMDLLSRMKDAAPLRAEDFEAARTTLRGALAVSARPETGPRQGSHLRKLTWGTRGKVGLGITAVAAGVAAAVVALSVTSSPAPQQHHAAAGGGPTAGATDSAAAAGNPRLAQLADYIEIHEISLPGDATLEIRNQSPTSAEPGGNGVDLLTDSGKYYWALTESGLPQAIADHDDSSQGEREVAAALYAVHGNITTARARMAVANLDPGVTPKQITPKNSKPLTPERQADNEIWSNSLDALNAGAGNPQARVGVLRLLSTVPDVTVTPATTDGQSTLTLSETWQSPSGPTQEVLVINAGTGLPVVTMDRQPGGQLTGVTYYHVSRVTLATVAAGKF